MDEVEGWARRFWRLSLFAQMTVVVAAAMAAALVLTLIFYSIFFGERLALDLALTAVITSVVGYPLSYIFLKQSRELVRVTEELDQRVKIDDLTGLFNRRAFLAEAHAIIRESGGESAGALLFIDADHFKSVNDAWGHLTGDAVLRELGLAVREGAREGDPAGRLGGEEFALFAAGADREEVERICETIRENTQRIAEKLKLDGVAVTVSIGVSIHREGQDLEDLLRSADKSLYTAKLQGRDRVVYSGRRQVAA